METKKYPEERITDLYLRTLARQPTAERARTTRRPCSPPRPTPNRPSTDIFWALLNCREFLFNH